MVNILPSIDTSGNGVIRIESSDINTVTTPYGIWATIIQNKNKNTYIDNQTSATGTLAFSPSVNIGTIIPNQNINLGTTTSNVNIAGGTLQYMGTNIINSVQADTTALSFTPTVSSASWQVITGLSCAGITTRRTTSSKNKHNYWY